MYFLDDYNELERLLEEQIAGIGKDTEEITNNFIQREMAMTRKSQKRKVKETVPEERPSSNEMRTENE